MGPQLPPVGAGKAAWRAEVRRLRRDLVQRQGPAGRAAHARSLTAAALPWLESYAVGLGRVGLRGLCVTAFAAMPSEPPVDDLVATLRERGVEVLLPLTLPGGVLRWTTEPAQGHPMRPAAEAGSGRGAEALSEVDVALVPALAVARDGRRLGQGGGYYDRAVPVLRSRRSPAPVVAVLHDHEWVADLPSQAHDIRVDAVLTTRGVEPVSPPGQARDGAGPAPRPPLG
jgi:5-formyltetrahydrofolate cyclo-ligase